MTEHAYRHASRHGRQIAAMMATFIASTIALHWAWKTTLSDWGVGPELRVIDFAAAEIALALLVLFLSQAWHVGRGR